MRREVGGSGGEGRADTYKLMEGGGKGALNRSYRGSIVRLWWSTNLDFVKAG